VTSPAAARFLREARVTGQLEHPNIVPVYELGRRADGTLYYAMKLVRGRTLAEALRGCESLKDRLGLLSHYVDLCQAIAYAHSRGVIHRDIKPDNVMLGEFGETVVLDWGLAKARGQEDLRARELRREVQLHQDPRSAETGRASQTVAGSTMGTPAYMSPEQVRGELDQIDEQSDVWSLGAVLYELLTGRPPHTARSVPELLDQVVSEPVAPARRRDPAIPPELAAVTSKALRRDRAKRYRTAGELAREIEAFQSGARVTSYEYSSWELLRRFVARNKTLSVAALLLLVILAGSTGAIYRAYRRADQARDGEAQARRRAEGARRAEHHERLRAQDREREAHLNLSVAFQEKADRLLEAHNHSAARIFAAAALLHNPGNPLGPHYHQHRATRPLANPAAARRGLVAAQSTLFAARMFQALRFEGRIAAHAKQVWSVAFFPDGERVASASVDHTVRLWSVPGGRRLRVLRGSPTRIIRVAVSRDGKRVAAACGDGAVRLWDADSGELRKTLKAHRAAAVGVDFSPDGRRLATSGLDRTARIWELPGGRPLQTLEHENKNVWAVAFSPDGDKLAAASWQGGPSRILIWDLANGKKLAAMTGHLGPAWTVDWSPDGTELASGGVDKTIRLWSVKDRRQRSRLRYHRGDVTAVRYLPHGDLLASTGVDRRVALWLRPSESVIASHRAHEDHIWSLDLSADGRRLVTGSWDGDLRQFTVRPQGRTRLFVMPDRRPALGIRYSPDGRELLMRVGPQVRILRTAPDAHGPATGKKRREAPRLKGKLAGHTDEVDALDISRNGRWVATASRDRTARIWDLRTRKSVAVLRDHHARVYCVAFAPTGRLVATGGGDRMIRLWRVPSGEAAGVLSGHPGRVSGLAFSADGQQLASTSGSGRIRRWSMPDGKPLPAIEQVPDDVDELAFAKGGRWLLAAANDDLLVWDTRTRKRHRTLRGHRSEILRLEVTADQRHAITSGRDNQVIIWDLETLRAVQHLGFDLLPLGVSMRNDHQGFAVATGVPIQLFPFQPDLWRQDPGKLLKEAEKTAGLHLRRFRLVSGR
jgi:WD40 repeat protein